MLYRRIASLMLVAALSACGDDSIPEAEDSASSAEISAAVGGAQSDAIDAGLASQGLPNSAEGEAALAEEIIASSNNEAADAPLTPPIGPATGPGVRRTPADPATEDPLPRIQPRAPGG